MENNEITHDIPTITMEQMSLIQWGLNSLFSFNISAKERDKVEQLLELLDDC